MGTRTRRIPTTVITDNMAGALMNQGKVDCGRRADRIAANGDTANKIGTYGVAILARTSDSVLCRGAALDDRSEDPHGQHIPIEERSARK